MRKSILALAIAALVVPLLVAPQAAEASAYWNVGTNFSVGGVHFSLGFIRPYRYRSQYTPSYYYRTSHRISHRGYSCGSACYVKDDYYYHDRSCPLVDYHFRHNRFDPNRAFSHGGYGYSSYYRSHAPAPRYYGSRHHRSYDWCQSHQRYERRDDRYSSRRFERRGQRDQRGDQHSTRSRDRDRDRQRDQVRDRDDRRNDGRRGNDDRRGSDRRRARPRERDN